MPKLKDSKDKKNRGMLGMFFTSGRDSSGSEEMDKEVKDELPPHEVIEEDLKTLRAKAAHAEASRQRQELLELQQKQQRTTQSKFVPKPPAGKKKSPAITKFEERIRRELEHYAKDGAKTEKLKELQKDFTAFAETKAGKKLTSFPDFEERLTNITRPNRRIGFD